MDVYKDFVASVFDELAALKRVGVGSGLVSRLDALVERIDLFYESLHFGLDMSGAGLVFAVLTRFNNCECRLFARRELSRRIDSLRVLRGMDAGLFISSEDLFILNQQIEGQQFLVDLLKAHFHL